MDIGKIAALPLTIKDALYVSKTVKNVGLVGKIYESICLEKLQNVYTMLLFSPTQLTTVNLMLSRLLKVQSVLTYLPYASVNERTQRNNDESFEMYEDLTVLLSGKSFRSRVREAYFLFNPLPTFIGLLESTSATMADVYTTFVATLLCLQFSHVISVSERTGLEVSLLRLWSRIYSAVHALAFRRDRFYEEFRNYVTCHFGSAVLELGKGSLTDQCHKMIENIAIDDAHAQMLLSDYLKLCVTPSSLLKKLKQAQPRLFGDKCSASGVQGFFRRRRKLKKRFPYQPISPDVALTHGHDNKGIPAFVPQLVDVLCNPGMQTTLKQNRSSSGKECIHQTRITRAATVPVRRVIVLFHTGSSNACASDTADAKRMCIRTQYYVLRWRAGKTLRARHASRALYAVPRGRAGAQARGCARVTPRALGTLLRAGAPARRFARNMPHVLGSFSGGGAPARCFARGIPPALGMVSRAGAPLRHCSRGTPHAVGTLLRAGTPVRRSARGTPWAVFTLSRTGKPARGCSGCELEEAGFAWRCDEVAWGRALETGVADW
ncbi:hypothetical protein FGB62_49g225 [Gracilaria domingensis]|nr:hypothetical protein FGB62_49g225 [Gracilaria domingensis]